MKKLILILIIALFPLFSNAQSIFSKFEDNDDVTTVIVNKKTFEMMANIEVDDPDAKQMMEMVKGLDQLKVFTTTNPKVGAEMKGVLDSYLKKSKLSELLRVNDKEAKVKIYVKEGKNDNHVTELLMLVNSIDSGHKNAPETVILSITGDIYLDKISKLINQMGVSGGDALKN